MLTPGLPKLYAILDAGLTAERGLSAPTLAERFVSSGARLIQYRKKQGDVEALREEACAIRAAVEGSGCRLILNDHPHLARELEWDGVHVGQGDMSPVAARREIGAERLLGTSTHTDTQVARADREPLNYIAVGPVFATVTKANPDPVIELEGVRRARALTQKPLVAIGGITLRNAAAVIAAGADSVALISELIRPGERTEEIIRDLLAQLG